MTVKIGRIPYLNSVLFYHGFDAGTATVPGHDVELTPLVPRALSGAVAEDAVDTGPVPVVTCWDVEDRYEPLGDFSIAVPDKAYSILLFSRRPFEELGGARIGVTGETSTSVRLMKVLLAQVWRVEPAAYDHLDWPRNDAFLLIGDEALLHSRGVDSYPYVADLGEVWHRWTGLPFVFARWIVRRDLDAGVKDALVAAVSSSLESGWRDVDRVVAPHASRLNMTVAEMRAYLEAFHFRMEQGEHDAIARFRELDAALRGADPAPTVGP